MRFLPRDVAENRRRREPPLGSIRRCVVVPYGEDDLRVRQVGSLGGAIPRNESSEVSEAFEEDARKLVNPLITGFGVIPTKNKIHKAISAL